MNPILLLGAGFSHNWGGWLANEAFEYLLGVPTLDEQGRRLLWDHKTEGFEAALSALQKIGGASLDLMEDAVRQMFQDMNRGFFADRADFEFVNETGLNSVCQFLGRFDAIFTLNQDLLLELGYCRSLPQSISTRRTWSGFAFPGMTPRVDNAMSAEARFAGGWCPDPAGTQDPNAHTQPIYKLHGSSNWVDASGQRMLVMGGDKTASINGSSILAAYAAEFERRLNLPDTRLVVIGYGFGDNHINMALDRAAQAGGLRTFIVDPAGADAPDPNRGRQMMIKPRGPQNAVQGSIAGASRRPLSRIFGGDAIERDKVLRFLTP